MNSFLRPGSRDSVMINLLKNMILVVMLPLFAVNVQAESSGFNSDAVHKVVYDVKTRSSDDFSNVLDRISYLNARLGGDPLTTSIVVVLHGDEINYFANHNELDFEPIVTRAQSLTVGETIEFRVCRVSAKRRGYRPEDLQDFVHVVPMADAEIVQLQFNGYAYMR